MVQASSSSSLECLQPGHQRCGASDLMECQCRHTTDLACSRSASTHRSYWRFLVEAYRRALRREPGRYEQNLAWHVWSIVLRVTSHFGSSLNRSTSRLCSVWSRLDRGHWHCHSSRFRRGWSPAEAIEFGRQIRGVRTCYGFDFAMIKT